MQKAVIFLVEDFELLSDSLCELIPFSGHQVVLKASTLEEALQIVNSGQLRESGVNVAVVDGNFPSIEMGREVFGGPIVARAIRDKEPSIKIIAHTASSAKEATYGDVYAGKRYAPESLFEAITSL